MNSKYKAKKVVIDGIQFDSKAEGDRYLLLRDKEKRGEIHSLRLQVKYPLLDSYKLNGKCIERGITYVADFVYIEDDEIVVEDVKGFETPVWKIKKKLFLHRYGFQIRMTGLKENHGTRNKNRKKERQ